MTSETEIEQLRATLRHLKDRQDILDCIVREARGRDRHDAAMTASCYWEDGVDEHGPVINPGPQYGEKANAGHRAFFSGNSHNLANHACEIDGDVAHCETYVVGGLLSLDQTACTIAMGRYIDLLERRNDQWKIKLRRTMIDMVSTGDASWLHSPAVAGFLKGLRSKDDPSYHRPNRLNPADERW
jgi:SnoaL-like domain